MNWKYFYPRFEYETLFEDLAWPWAGHKFFAYDLVRNIKPRVIVELGTHKGTSVFSMCQAVKDGKLSTKVYAIDTWIGDKHSGFYDESVFSDVNKIKKKYYDKLSLSLVRKTFDEAKENFKNDSIDILHIDGLHTEEAIKHDYETWKDKVKPDGIILFHDIVEKGKDFGVYKIWKKLKRNYNTLEFDHSHGLGILLKNIKTYKELSALQIPWKLHYSQLYQKKLKAYAFDTEIKYYRVRAQLSTIMDSKFFKIWLVYNQIKNIVLNKNATR